MNDQPVPGGLVPAAGNGPRRCGLVLRGCRIEGDSALRDIAMDGPVILAVGQDLAVEGTVELAADGRLASPAFVQPHLHLDKVGVAPLLPANRSGTLAEAVRLLHQTKSVATVQDVASRAGEVIRLAVMAGTTVIRSHVDVDTIGGLTPLRGVQQAAREHADICEVQIVAFPQEGLRRDPGAETLLAAAMDAGADIVGGMPHWERTAGDARAHVRFCLELAREYDADVDMHIDETDDPASRTLQMLLDVTEEFGWQGRVTAGHCCAMAAWDAEYTAVVISRVVRLGVSVVTNPATNLLLQGREDYRPRRGLPPVKELLAAGVRVACGQDCVQDAFYPFGMADPLQVALMLCHAAQLSTPTEIDAALATIRVAAAEVVGYQGYGLAPGCVADVVVLEAETAAEALRTQAARRFVIRKGRLVAQATSSRQLYRQLQGGGEPSVAPGAEAAAGREEPIR